MLENLLMLTIFLFSFFWMVRYVMSSVGRKGCGCGKESRCGARSNANSVATVKFYPKKKVKIL
ncbi:hypothetical protein ACQZV8_08455 [Magnetococcales bacterium HHB-1]